MKKRFYLLSILLSTVIACCSLSCANKGNTLTIHITDISINETFIELVEGETFTLQVEIEPDNATNKEVTWSTNDQNIAIVNDLGVVEAIKEGSTSIVVTCNDNPNIYASCQVNVKSIYSQALEDDEVIFTNQTMTAYVYSKNNSSQMNTCFRNDILKQYPYVSLKEYYKTLLNKDLEIEKAEDNLYLVTSGNGGTAIINTELDTLDSDDYERFIATTIYRQDGVKNVYFDGAPFIRVNHTEYKTPAHHKTINFKKYGISLIGKENDIYLPLVTASNIFMGPTMITCFYNKDSIYFIDPNDPEFDTGTAIRNYNYQNGIYKFYNDDKRTSDEARFTYGEICFLVDTYYGLPGREYLHKDLVKYHDLDKALLENSDMTRIARTYLLSTDISKYFAGMLMLDSFLSDAGHSVTSYGVQLALSLDSKTALKDKVLENLSDIGFDSNNYAAKRNASQNYRNSLRTVINNMGFVDCSYMRKGNTLMYTFDSFNFDIHDWNKYYKNPNIDNLPKDALGNFKKMLEEHKDNSSIKNIVINISNNGGGYGDLVVAFLGLMGCETYQHMHDMINDNYVTTYYDFDANFDGVFDEKDKNVQYNFRFAILCSARSFSCGNLLPALAKESGIMILGDKSGGGSCAVIDATSAEGFYIRLSCQNHLAYLNGEEVEYGVPADYTLVVDNGDDTYDFSNFYNMEIVSSEIDKFYI